MLMPSKVKFRKQQRGRMRGTAYKGSDLSFGEYGLQALEPGWPCAAARLHSESSDSSPPAAPA